MSFLLIVEGARSGRGENKKKSSLNRLKKWCFRKEISKKESSFKDTKRI